MMKLNRWIIGLCLCVFSILTTAQENTADQETAVITRSLSELAAEADLIALVRVLDTDYEYTREFPSGGSAFLEVLIPYKVGRPLEDIIEVYEEGLHEGECYFKNPTVLEEGRRHLVFLQFHPDVAGQYQGLASGCRLEVLVTADNGYALRYPVSGMDVSDELEELAGEMKFADSYAVFKFEDFDVAERLELEESGYLVRDGEQYRYTHGIPISEIRKLMGPDALTYDRSLK